MTRLSIFASIIALTSLPALGHAVTLNLGAYGGTTEKVFREQIIPMYEEKTQNKVVFVPGNSTDTLAKLVAQKSNPQFDVVLMDDSPMEQAQQFGLCAPLEAAPVYDDLYPLAKMGESSTALGVVASGIFYSKEAFAKAGWDAPTSWQDLADSKYHQKVVIPPISNSYGLHALIKFAELNGGGVHNIDPGFDAIIDKVADNVLAWEPSNGKMSELFQNGSAVIGVWGSGRVYALQQTGFATEFVYPKEGAVALFITTCVVARPDVKPEAQEFVQFLLSPEIQEILAESEAWGPVNSKTKLKPEVASAVPYGPEQINQLQGVDFSVVNVERGKWTNRWNRTVER